MYFMNIIAFYIILITLLLKKDIDNIKTLNVQYR